MTSANIWALEKDLRLKHVLLLLEDVFGPGKLNIHPELPADHRAIYLTHRENSGIRAYLFTLGQANERYGVHLEFAADSAVDSLLESYENLSFKSLTEILSVHLDLLYQQDSTITRIQP